MREPAAIVLVAICLEARQAPHVACTLGQVDVATLRELALFGGLDDALLARLSTELDVITFEVGELALVEGARGRDLFVVLEGSLEVSKQTHPHVTCTVTRLGEGDMFGEVALLDMMPRSASVRATARTRALRVTAAELDRLYRHDTRAYALVVMNLARDLSRKLRALTVTFAELSTRSEPCSDHERQASGFYPGRGER